MVQWASASQASQNQEQVSTQVPTKSFTGTIQGTLGFTTVQVKVLVEGGYDTQEAVLFWKFTYVKEWCQLKSKIPVSRGCISYGDIKINFLQALVWWVTDLTL